MNDYLKLFATIPLESTPGKRHRYGNSGYVLLGALIEAISGENYFDAMHKAIYQPAGMQDTGHLEMDLPAANCAIGYTNESWFSPPDGQRRANTFLYAVKGSPSEHCFSTVEDLFRFFQALNSGLLLDPRHVELCLTAHTPGEKPGVSYGYGFHIFEDGKRGRVIGHGGRAMGGDAFALEYLELGCTLIVLANYDRPAARSVVNAIADLLIS